MVYWPSYHDCDGIDDGDMYNDMQGSQANGVSRSAFHLDRAPRLFAKK